MPSVRKGLGIQRNRKQQKYSNTLTHHSRTSVKCPSSSLPVSPHACVPVSLGLHPFPKQAVTLMSLGLCSFLLQLPYPSSSLAKCPSSFYTSCGRVSSFSLGHITRKVHIPPASIWALREGLPYFACPALSTTPGYEQGLKNIHSFDKG